MITSPVRLTSFSVSTHGPRDIHLSTLRRVSLQAARATLFMQMSNLTKNNHVTNVISKGGEFMGKDYIPDLVELHGKHAIPTEDDEITDVYGEVLTEGTVVKLLQDIFGFTKGDCAIVAELYWERGEACVTIETDDYWETVKPTILEKVSKS